MAERDLLRDERLGAAIAELPVPPETEGFWDELRAALAEPVPEPKPTKRRRSGRERVLVLGLAALGLTLGGLGALHFSLRGGSSSSCAALVVWHHNTYAATGRQIKIHVGRPLGTGTFPPCDDTGGGPAGSSTTVRVYAIRGVSPAKAVFVGGQAGWRWVRVKG